MSDFQINSSFNKQKMQNILIAKRIRKIRELRDYSQEFMANKLKIETSAYGRIERGETSLKVVQLQEISKILDVEPEYFMQNDDSITINNPVLNNPLNGIVNGNVTNNTNEELLNTLLILMQQTSELINRVLLDRKS